MKGVFNVHISCIKEAVFQAIGLSGSCQEVKTDMTTVHVHLKRYINITRYLLQRDACRKRRIRRLLHRTKSQNSAYVHVEV
jgi:hypothetical protein